MIEKPSIEAWLWATPNSNRVSIMLEELGLPYTVRPVNIRKREQFAPQVTALNPYGKIPILTIDGPEGRQVLFESGAILLHLAEAHGQFLPLEAAAKAEVLTWLMLVLTGLGPSMGQAHHWTALAPEKPQAAIDHSVRAATRAVEVIEARLGSSPYLCAAYSIADIAAYPWLHRLDWARLDLGRLPNIARWLDEVGSREAVKRGMAMPIGAKLE